MYIFLIRCMQLLGGGIIFLGLYRIYQNGGVNGGCLISFSENSFKRTDCHPLDTWIVVIGICISIWATLEFYLKK